MTDAIKCPGFHRNKSGGKVEIIAIRGSIAYGKYEDGNRDCLATTGHFIDSHLTRYDIVGEWREPDEVWLPVTHFLAERVMAFWCQADADKWTNSTGVKIRHYREVMEDNP